MDDFLLIPVKIVQQGGPGCGAVIVGVIIVAIISFCNPSPTKNKNIRVETDTPSVSHQFLMIGTLF